MTGGRAAKLSFKATLIEWRGPAPYVFAPVPGRQAEAVRQAAKALSYGWGVVPVTAAISGTGFATSLFPRDGTYLLPLRADVRRRCGVTVGDAVEVELSLG